MEDIARAHVCIPFHISVAAVRFVLKFGAMVDTKKLCVLHKPLLENISARAHVKLHQYPIKQIYTLPLVNRPKYVSGIFRPEGADRHVACRKLIKPGTALGLAGQALTSRHQRHLSRDH